MANAAKALPDIILDLDKPRKFRLSWYALCCLEKRIGIEALREIRFEDPGLNGFTNILWAGLLVDDPTLTFEQVCDMMSVDTFGEIRAKVVAGIIAAMPATEDEDAKKKDAAISMNGATPA